MTPLLAVVLLALAFPALSANAVLNCTGTGALPNTCRAVTDAYASAGTQPALCRLYSSGVAVVTVSVAGPAGALYCDIPMPPASFPNGTYTLTVATLSSDGAESLRSSPYILQSSKTKKPKAGAAPQWLCVANP